MTFARFATVAVPLPPREPSAGPTGSPAAVAKTLPPVRLGAVTGRDTALMPLYPAGRRHDDRETALLPVCGDVEVARR